MSNDSKKYFYGDFRYNDRAKINNKMVKPWNMNVLYGGGHDQNLQILYLNKKCIVNTNSVKL